MTALEGAQAALERGDFTVALADLADEVESPEVLALRGDAAYGAR